MKGIDCNKHGLLTFISSKATKSSGKTEMALIHFTIFLYHDQRSSWVKTWIAAFDMEQVGKV